jgi:Protein of unknown function (DUF3352)
MGRRLASSLLTVAAAGLATLVVAGCGGGGTGSASGGDSAAGIVPATAPVFLSFDTDLSSRQIVRADALLKKFPIRERLLSSLRRAITSDGTNLRGLLRSVGPEVDIAVLDVDRGTTVGFTKPVDEKLFEQSLLAGKTKFLFDHLHGWLVFSDDKTALDDVKHADAKLGDDRTYKDATADLPDEALAKAYVARGAVAQGLRTLGPAGVTINADNARWVTAAALAHDDGVDVQVNVHGKDVLGGAKNFKSTLTDDVPAGALAALSFNDAGSAIRKLQGSGIPGLGSIRQAIGVDLDQLARVLDDEAVVYVRAGNPIPEVTLVAKESDPEAAKRTVAAMVRKLGANARTSTTEVDGVKLTAVDLGSVTIFYGTFEGKLIITDDSNAVRDVRGHGEKLKDDKTFTDAAGAAGLPDSTNGWLYLDLKDAVPVVDALVQLGGAKIPGVVAENLRPLRSFVAYASRAGDTETIRLFLATN